jgi:hypothetical protein
MCRILSSNPSVWRRWAVISGSIAVFLFATAEAGADDTHYRGIPIGAHAIGLGGAFTGVADDVSAAYFNPAGLVLPGGLGIAAGLTINAWERIKFDDVFAGTESVGATFKSSRSVPIFVGAGIRFGPLDRDDNRPNSMALSVVDPIYSTGSTFLKFESQPPELSDSYRISQSDRATWYGISYARRLSRKQSLGASLFLSVRKLYHSEVGLSLDGGMPLPSDPSIFEGVSSTANNQALDFKAFHFVLRFGWLYKLKPQVQLGIMVQLPGIPLKQRVNVFSQGFINDNRDPSTPLLTDPYYLDRDVDARLPLPGELAVGVQYWPAEKVMLSVNAWVYTPVPSHNRVDISEPVPVGGLFFDDDTKRLATGNVAVAGDFFIRKEVSIEAGFFTDLSSAVRVPSDPTHYYNARTQRLGGTLSVAVNVAGIALAVGSTFIYGRGDATGAVVNFDDLTASYTTTQLSSRIVYLHLTGATRAVVGLGGKAEHGIQQRRANKKAGED